MRGDLRNSEPPHPPLLPSGLTGPVTHTCLAPTGSQLQMSPKWPSRTKGCHVCLLLGPAQANQGGSQEGNRVQRGASTPAAWWDTLAGADTGRSREGRERFLLCSRPRSCSLLGPLLTSHGPFPVN